MLCLIPTVSLEAKPDIKIKKRLFSRIIIINGVRVKISRPIFRKKKRVLPLENYQSPPVDFNNGIPIPYYDHLYPNDLGNLA